MKKKAMTWLLAAALFAGAVGAAFAQTAADFNVELTDDGAGVRIKEYTGKAARVVIPATIEGMPVREIGKRAFSIEGSWGTQENKTLTSVTFPPGLISIGERAFEYCSNLTTVTFPPGLTTIGKKAFSKCSKFVSVLIPDSVTEIGEYAFSECIIPDPRTPNAPSIGGLTTVTLGKGLVKIGKGAFSQNEFLKTLTIPEGVTLIGESMFSYCSALASVKIPNSVKSIGAYAFSNSASGYEPKKLSALTSITLPTGITVIPDNAFSGTGLTGIVIPEGVTEIGENAFQWCSALVSVTLPSTIKAIGSRAFSQCSALTTVTIPDTVEALEFFYINNRGYSSAQRRTENRADMNYSFPGCAKLNLASQAAIKKRLPVAPQSTYNPYDEK